MDLKTLEDFLGPAEALIDRTRRISAANWLTELQGTAVNQFVKEYDALKSGKDPDQPVEPGER